MNRVLNIRLIVYMCKNILKLKILSLKKNLNLIKMHQQFENTFLRITIKVITNLSLTKITDMSRYLRTVVRSQQNQNYVGSSAGKKAQADRILQGNCVQGSINHSSGSALIILRRTSLKQDRNWIKFPGIGRSEHIRLEGKTSIDNSISEYYSSARKTVQLIKRVLS